MKCNCSSRSGAQQKSYPAACTSRSVAFEPSFTGRVWCSAAVQLLMYLGHGSAKRKQSRFWIPTKFCCELGHTWKGGLAGATTIKTLKLSYLNQLGTKGMILLRPTGQKHLHSFCLPSLLYYISLLMWWASF